MMHNSMDMETAEKWGCLAVSIEVNATMILCHTTTTTVSILGNTMTITREGAVSQITLMRELEHGQKPGPGQHQPGPGPGQRQLGQHGLGLGQQGPGLGQQLGQHGPGLEMEQEQEQGPLDIYSAVTGRQAGSSKVTNWDSCNSTFFFFLLAMHATRD